MIDNFSVHMIQGFFPFITPLTYDIIVEYMTLQYMTPLLISWFELDSTVGIPWFETSIRSYITRNYETFILYDSIYFFVWTKKKCIKVYMRISKKFNESKKKTLFFFSNKMHHVRILIRDIITWNIYSRDYPHCAVFQYRYAFCKIDTSQFSLQWKKYD